MIEFVSESSGKRLDKFLAEVLGNTRSEMEEYFNESRVFVNGEVKKPSYKVKEGDRIAYEKKAPVSLDVLPEDIPLDIVYEDEDIIAVNKPRGMIVHPSGKIVTGTLVNALLNYSDSLSEINGVMRPGIVHRLDKDTTGIILIAKNKKAHLSLSEQFKARTVEKIYYALVFGRLNEAVGEIEAPIARDRVYRQRMAVDYGGRYAKTTYKVERVYDKYSLLRVNILTGRTHQIRVHMAYIRHPVVGDTLYHNGKNEFGLDGQLLHAYSIRFHHPSTGESMLLKADFPENFSSVLEKLRYREI